MYIHSGQTIRASRNPRLELKSLYHVAFPQQRRSPAYVNGRQSFCPYLGSFDSRCSKARSDDHHFFKLPRAFGVHIISDRRRRRRLAQPATGQHNVIAAYLITYVSATEHVGKNPLQRTLACVYGHFYIAQGISLIKKILAGLLSLKTSSAARLSASTVIPRADAVKTAQRIMITNSVCFILPPRT